MMEKALVVKTIVEDKRADRYLPELTCCTAVAIVAMAGVVMMTMPHMAFAAGTPSSVAAVFALIPKALTVVGIGLALWGAVKVATALSNGSGASGNELSEGIGRGAGGLLIIFAATYFGNILTESGF